MFLPVVNFINSSSAAIFWMSAIFGTLLFILRISMTVLGSSFEMEDADMDADGFELDGHEHHHAFSSYKMLSLHSLSGFFMMFGWVGLACNNQLGLPVMQSLLFGFIAGILIMFITALLFKSARLLQAPGDLFNVDNTVSLMATVYQRIPSHGQGKIHVAVNGVTRELLAQSFNKKTIESFANVKIVQVIDTNTVEVIQI